MTDVRPTEFGANSEGSPFDIVAFLVAVRPKWQRQAACIGYPPEWWWPEANEDVNKKRALEICRRCPVRSECLEHGLDNRDEVGIWGGLTERQRKALRKTIRQANIATAEVFEDVS